MNEQHELERFCEERGFLFHAHGSGKWGSERYWTYTLLSCVRVSKMQGAEIEDEGSVLECMTKSEIEEQRCSMLIMTQRYFFCAHLRCYSQAHSKQYLK